MLIESARHTRLFCFCSALALLMTPLITSSHVRTHTHIHTEVWMFVPQLVALLSSFHSPFVLTQILSFFLSNKLKYVVSGNHSPGLAALQFSAVTLWVAPCLFPLLWLFKKKIAGMKNWTFFLSKPRGKLCLFHWMEKLCVTSVFTIWHVLAMWVIILCFWLAHELSDHSGIYHFL